MNHGLIATNPPAKATTHVRERAVPRVSAAGWALAACALVLVGLAYLRLSYGIDFTDESFYVAVPYRFVLGAKPYVDELSVTQTNAAILLYPFVWSYDRLVGTTAIVLYLRQLHFVLSLALGVATFLSLRRLLGLGAATVVAAVAFVFVPFDIPSVGYDSLASALFTAGCLLGFHARDVPRARLAAGICLGFAAFVYPPLVLGVVAACAVRLRRRDELATLVAPALLLPAAGFAALGAAFGLHRIVDDYRRSARYLGQAGGVAKLQQIGAHEWATFPHWPFVLAALPLLALTWRRHPRVAAVAIAILPLAFLPPHPLSYSASLDYVAHYGWLALPLFVGLRKDRNAGLLLLLVWIPALVAGLTTAYSSANGGVNFGVGFFPAAIVTAVFSVLAVKRLAVGFAVVPAAVAAVLFICASLLPVYRDASLWQLDARIHGGPYAGLVTSSRKRAWLDGLERNLAGVTPSCSISFFRDFPAGYLLTGAAIDTNGVWTATAAPKALASYDGSLVRYYARHGLPNVIVLMRRIPYAPPASARLEGYRRSDPLLELLRRDAYRPTAATLDYTVYRRAPC
jgi:hypothetical protein